MEFAVLGPLEVRTASGAVAIRRGLPRTLLVALLLRPGQTVSSDFLVDVLWGDELPRNPANALQIQVSYLRKTLGSAERDGASLLDTRAGGYALVLERDRVDAHRFESMVTQFPPLGTLRSAEALEAALTKVDAALGLWRGEALEDVADAELARGEITRLDELRWAATERRIELLLCLGRHTAAVGDLALLVQRMPLRERFHEQRVLALYRSGRQAEAPRAYEEARKTLGDGLGLDLGPDLKELERAVLRVKLRLVNTMDSDHPMHHPFHIHGAGRFLVISRGDLPEPNLVWKDTVLVRAGEIVDIVLDVTSPGLWMAHCHIAEHNQDGMMFSFRVDPA